MGTTSPTCRSPAFAVIGGVGAAANTVRAMARGSVGGRHFSHRGYARGTGSRWYTFRPGTRKPRTRRTAGPPTARGAATRGTATRGTAARGSTRSTGTAAKRPAAKKSAPAAKRSTTKRAGTGISRVDQESTRTHGYAVRIGYERTTTGGWRPRHTAFFGDASHGSQTKALRRRPVD